MRSPKDKKAFTLVELLVVVAIIGVLAATGVPTYRKMVQRARKSEAKIILGAIYSHEHSFRGEFGVFGNNLWNMGLQLEGATPSPSGVSPSNLLCYSVGFTTKNICGVGFDVMPDIAEPAGIAIFSKNPDYYQPNHVSVYNPQAKSGVAFCDPANLSLDRFLATASGMIVPGGDINTTNRNLLDIWSMNEKREIINVQDGVQ